MSNKLLQKDIFLQSEADEWFERNKQATSKQLFTDDMVCKEIKKIVGVKSSLGKTLKILEVGCGQGFRLSWLSKEYGCQVYGIEPSKKAVTEAVSRGVVAIQGTADFLPYENEVFDILIFGFCLYLCDQQDLFKIAHEADRVLKKDSWLIINDFYYPGTVTREYHHKSGVQSHKMDYRKLFEWHPAYICYSHQIERHGFHEYCDDPQEWVPVSTMRKGGHR